MCSGLNRFRNEYRTRYLQTESAPQNPPAHGADSSSRDVFKNFFVDRIDADLSTVDPQPLICSTPISINSRTAALNQNKQELVTSTGVAGFVKIPISGSRGEPSDRRIQATCRPESEQGFNTLLKHAIVSDSPGLDAKKGQNVLERETPMMFESDDEEDVEADKGEAILLEAEMTGAPLEPHDVQRPHVKLYACDTSAVVEPLSPTVKLQARKRLSFMDKETPFGSKTPASELTKLSQPEDKIRQTPRFIKIPVPSEISKTTAPSGYTASKKDTRLGNHLHINETQHTLRKPTTDKMELLERTQALTDSKETIRASEKKLGNSSQPLNEKSTNRFASMLFKTMHPENKLLKSTQNSLLPHPLTTEYDLEEDFEIDEVSSYIFKSWDREFKNVKPSTKQPTAGAAEIKKCVNLEQKDTEVLDLHTVYAPPNSFPLDSSRKKTATETKKVRALANAKEISSLQQQNKKSMVKKQKARQTVLQSYVTYDNHCSTVIATDSRPSNKTVSMEANLPTEVEECSSSPVSKNQASLKRKTDESQVKSKISSTLPKKTKKVFEVGALEKEMINMRNIENATSAKDRLSLSQTYTNENVSTYIPLPKNVLTEPVPEKMQENIPQELVNQDGGQMLGRNILRINKSANSMSETEKNRVPSVKNTAEFGLTRNLPLKDRGKIKEKQVNKNQAVGGPEKEDWETKNMSAPLKDTSEKNPVLKSYLSQNEGETPPSVSRRGRVRKSAAAWWVINPEQDLLCPAETKKTVSRKHSEHFSKEKQVHKNQTAGGPEKENLDTKHMSAPLEDTSEKSPVLKSDLSENEEETPPSVSRKLSERFSKKKQVNKNQAAGGPEKENLDTKHMSALLEDTSEKSPVLKSYLSQNEEETPPVSRRGRVQKPAAAWWVVNPEQDLLCPAQRKKTVSRKLSERFSKRATRNKKIKGVKTSKIKSLQRVKLNNVSSVDLPADVDGKHRLVETNTANDKTNEQLGSLSENTERRYNSESQGKKRKIDDLAENNEVKQKPVKVKKSILKVSSKYKCPLSEERTERHLEEELENPKTEEGFALPSKMESRVSALRKSLLPSKQTQRLSSFKGSLKSFGAAYKTPVANKRTTPEFDPKSVTRRLSPTKSLWKRAISPDFTVKVTRSKSKRPVCSFTEGNSVSENERDGKLKSMDQIEEHFLKSVNVLQDDLEFNTHVKNIKRSYCKEAPEHIEHSKPNNNNLNNMNTLSCSEGNEEEGALRKSTQSNSDYSEDNSSSGKEDSIETELGHMFGQFDRRSEKKKRGTVDKNILAVTPQKEYFNRRSDTSKEKRGLNISNEMAQPACPATVSTTSESQNERELLTPSPPAFGCSRCIQSGSGRVPSRTVRMISQKDKPVRFDLCQTDLNSLDSDSDTNCTFVIKPAAEKEQKIVLPSHTPNVRRSKRTRVQPLDFWRGERVVYKLRPSGGFVVDGILSPEQKYKVYRRVKAKTKRPEQREMQGSVLITAENSPTGTQPTAVMDLVEGTEVYVECVKRQDQCVFFSAEGLPAVCKSFIQPMFSTGEIILAPLQEKGFGFVHLGTLVFYIINGEIIATLHNSQYQLKTGDYFFVPPGNIYNIQNLRKESDSNILFMHIKEQKQTETGDIG